MATHSFLLWPKYWRFSDIEVQAQVEATLVKEGVTFSAVRLIKNYDTPHPEFGQHFVVEVDTPGIIEKDVQHAAIERDAKPAILARRALAKGV